MLEHEVLLNLKNGRFYVLIPLAREPVAVRERWRVCAVDPGVRTAQTVYSEGEVWRLHLAVGQKERPNAFEDCESEST